MPATNWFRISEDRQDIFVSPTSPYTDEIARTTGLTASLARLVDHYAVPVWPYCEIVPFAKRSFDNSRVKLGVPTRVFNNFPRYFSLRYPPVVNIRGFVRGATYEDIICYRKKKRLADFDINFSSITSFHYERPERVQPKKRKTAP